MSQDSQLSNLKKIKPSQQSKQIFMRNTFDTQAIAHRRMPMIPNAVENVRILNPTIQGVNTEMCC